MGYLARYILAPQRVSAMAFPSTPGLPGKPVWLMRLMKMGHTCVRPIFSRLAAPGALGRLLRYWYSCTQDSVALLYMGCIV
jgi:hypothetical protein